MWRRWEAMARSKLPKTRHYISVSFPQPAVSQAKFLSLMFYANRRQNSGLFLTSVYRRRLCKNSSRMLSLGKISLPTARFIIWTECQVAHNYICWKIVKYARLMNGRLNTENYKKKQETWLYEMKNEHINFLKIVRL